MESFRTPKKKKGGAAENGQPMVTATMKKDAIAARASAERVVTTHQEKLDTLQKTFACYDRYVTNIVAHNGVEAENLSGGIGSGQSAR